MDLLRQVRREARSLGASEFERIYGGFFLLGELPVEEDDGLAPVVPLTRGDRDRVQLAVERLEAVPVESRRHERSTARVPRVSRETSRRRPMEAALWRVQNREGGGWRRRISVGRSPESDIVIPHISVSKVHAHFHSGTLVRLSPLHTAELLLADAGSMNGTVVGGRRLLSGEAEPVFSGNRILFGEVSCEVLSAAALYTRLVGTTR